MNEFRLIHVAIGLAVAISVVTLVRGEAVWTMVFAMAAAIGVHAEGNDQ